MPLVILQHRGLRMAILAGLVLAAALMLSERVPNADAQETIDWQDCGDGWECGQIAVPVNYDDPGGQSIDIAVSRLPAAAPEERIGVLLGNPGGPGAAGKGFARSIANQLPDDIRERFDIVGFDPRGTGDSAPVNCDEHLVDLFGVDQSPDDAREFERLQGLTEDYAEACDEQYGELLDHLGTRNVARDMDAIRDALGEEQVTYVGYSYGTRLGSVYADLFPERVRAMVLDGAVDNSLGTNDASLEQALGFERALERFYEHCREEGCGLDGDPAEVVAEILAAAEEEPIPASSAGRNARPGEVLLGIIVPLYEDRSWSLLGNALADAHAGDASTLVLFADTYLGIASTAVLNAVNCIDGQAPEDPVDTYDEYQEALPRYRDAAPTFGPSVIVDSCQYWNGGADPIGVPDAEGSAPLLVIGTTGDPATPYEWAEAMVSQLDNASLLRHEGDGHTVYLLGGSDCVDSVANRYILELEAPASGTTCAGDQEPEPPENAATPGADEATPGDEPTGPGSEGGDGTATPPAPATGDEPEQEFDGTRIALLGGVAALVLAVGSAAVIAGRR